MSTVESPPRYTPEALLTMPDEERYELICGELEERNVSSESSWIDGQLFGLLWEANRRRPTGWLFPEGHVYQCFPSHPEMVRRAGTSLVRRERLPDGPRRIGHSQMAPDLVVEVVTSQDLAEDVDAKLADWLSGGVAVVLLIFPRTRTVHIHRQSGRSFRLRLNDVLSLDDMIPGFSCRVAELFPSRPAAAAPSE